MLVNVNFLLDLCNVARRCTALAHSFYAQFGTFDILAEVNQVVRIGHGANLCAHGI